MFVLMHSINYWAILVAAASAFVLGGIWYSGAVFGKTWCVEAGVDMTVPRKKGHVPKVFILAFILSCIAAFAFAVVLGPNPNFIDAVCSGFVVGLFWVATSYGINYLFAERSLKLFLIDAGYHTVKFTLFGVVLGLWH